MHQLTLFDRPNLNIAKQQKTALNKAAKACGLSRKQILDRMNKLAVVHGINLASNGRLKIDTFEKWLNPNENRHMPMQALPVFCAVVGGVSALDVMVRPLGFQVIDANDLKLLKWAKAYFRAKHARSEMRSIEKEL